MLGFKTEKLIVFIVFITFAISLLIFLLSVLIKMYRTKEFYYKKYISKIKLDHEIDLLKSQLQVQEQTFQNISREIHDNIGQKLTLVKLQLNTMGMSYQDFSETILNDSVELLTECINDLRDVSRSLSTDTISNNGLIKAIESEISQICKTSRYNLKMIVTGESVFLPAEKELIIFRIIQESFSNIMKHANATRVIVELYYTQTFLQVCVIDNGIGFNTEVQKDWNGLRNIQNRAKSLNSELLIQSAPSTGTQIKLKIPIYAC